MCGICESYEARMVSKLSPNAGICALCLSTFDVYTAKCYTMSHTQTGQRQY